MITIDKISKSFHSDFWKKPKIILNQISTVIPQAKITGFLGENGAGKTTLMKIMLQFIRPDSGHIIFDPSMGSSKNEIYSKLAFMPERPYFYPHLTGFQLADYMGQLQKVEKKILAEKIMYWAKALDLDHSIHTQLKYYSKGMLQKLGLLSCFIHDPKLLILDEPLSGVDPYGRNKIKEILKNKATEGVSIFFSSHIMPDIEELADYIIFIGKGKIQYEGNPANLDLEKLYEFRAESAYVPST